jgi:poly-gamma-glutamate synthesis protein (capsule biosynthesis protein)
VVRTSGDDWSGRPGGTIAHHVVGWTRALPQVRVAPVTAAAGALALACLLAVPAGERSAGGGSPSGAGGADRPAASAAPAPGGDAPGEADRPPPAPPPTTAPPRSFTLVAAGDVLLHGALWDQARADAAAAGLPGHDFRPLLAGVKPLVSGADVAVCHLETPLAPAGGPYAGYPAFSVPPEIAPALAATGFDACSTASNHTYDRGADGVDRTLAGLDAAGIRHAGSARDPAEAAAVTLVPAGSARLALLSYTYGFNGIDPPGGQAWRSNPIDEARIRADAARARDAGADVVVVALHWGLEYQHEPNEQQRTLGPALVRSPDVDLVLGHHAHVVQPIEHVDGEWVVYGMGNFVAHQSTARPRTEEGLLVRFTFTEGEGGWHATAAEYAPLLVERAAPPVRLVDVRAALAAGGDPARLARLRAAWDTSVGVVGSLGAPEHGLRPIDG